MVFRAHQADSPEIETALQKCSHCIRHGGVDSVRHFPRQTWVEMESSVLNKGGRENGLPTRLSEI